MPLPGGGDTASPFPPHSTSGGPRMWALQCCLLGDLPAPLQQLDHGCRLSVRRLMPLHLVSKFRLCVQDVGAGVYRIRRQLGLFMVSRVFFHCLSLVAAHGQVERVWFGPHGTGGGAECLPSVAGNRGGASPPDQGFRLLVPHFCHRAGLSQDLAVLSL